MSTKHWFSSLAVGLTVLSLVSLTACQNNNNADAVRYLTEINEFYGEWYDLKSSGKSIFDDSYDHLITKLVAIEPPSQPIPIKTWDNEVIDYWSESDHNDYVSSYRNCLDIERLFATIEKAERERCEAIGYDDCAGCYPGEGKYSVYGSDEYVQTCWLKERTNRYRITLDVELRFLARDYGVD